MKFKDFLHDTDNVHMDESAAKDMDRKVYQGMLNIAVEIDKMVNAVSQLMQDAKLVDSKKYETLKESEKELIRIRTNLNKARMIGYK